MINYHAYMTILIYVDRYDKHKYAVYKSLSGDNNTQIKMVYNRLDNMNSDLTSLIVEHKSILNKTFIEKLYISALKVL